MPGGVGGKAREGLPIPISSWIVPGYRLAWIIHEQTIAVADSSKTPGLAGGRAPSGCSAVCFANCLAIRLRIALGPTSLRFFMNNPG